MPSNVLKLLNQIYRELAEQKKEKEDRSNANQPKERDYEKEQKEIVEKTREKEAQAGEAYVIGLSNLHLSCPTLKMNFILLQ